jgi:hypothetical protein
MRRNDMSALGQSGSQPADFAAGRSPYFLQMRGAAQLSAFGCTFGVQACDIPGADPQ